MSIDLDGGGFNANYRVLKETADWLSGQKEPDIDQLVPRVERAMRAYATCKDRLDQVQATLGQYFPSEVSPDASGMNGKGDASRRKPATRRPSADGEDGDDIPS